MARYKYNPGDYLGPYKVLFLKRDENNTKMGIFKCIECDKTFYSNIYNVNKGDRRYCDEHSNEIRRSIGKKFANNPKRKEAVLDVLRKIKPGQKYGHLTVLYPLEEFINTKRLWVCECDCEDKNQIKVRSDLLLNGHTQSCGCLGSLGEQKIGKILIEWGVRFSTQHIFDDCCNPETGHKLRFDFYLPDYQCCIEYDGKQHFEDTSGWFKKDSFKKIKKRDQIKNNYCLNKGIKLIRIPYTEYDNISLQYIKEKI